MMMPPQLPVAFEQQMRLQLGGDADSYFDALQKPPYRGLRINPIRQTSISLQTLLPELGLPIPWEPNGHLIPLDSTAGAIPLHEAGAYYLQEPSAMLSAALLAAQPGETVLDLCAAPGGKSTQLAAAMQGKGLLVCNEPVPSRAQILSRNIERMGISHALVVSADPAQLESAWSQLFDAVLVDAPCSGEGMFRRHPETRLEWSADAPAHCAARQKHILESACKMLKPGGRLCYSTCTFNRTENDDIVSWLLDAHTELSALDFAIPSGNGTTLLSENGGLHIYPHTAPGEGHFVALLQKNDSASTRNPARTSLLPPDEALAPPMQTACIAAFEAANEVAGLPAPNARLGETLLHAPLLPKLNGIRVLRAGLALGQCKGKLFLPDHALAMSTYAPAFRTVDADNAQAKQFLHGEVLPAPEHLHGYVIVQHYGLALGFAKSSDGWLKNHYPKGLRKSVT